MRKLRSFQPAGRPRPRHERPYYILYAIVLIASMVFTTRAVMSGRDSDPGPLALAGHSVPPAWLSFQASASAQETLGDWLGEHSPQPLDPVSRNQIRHAEDQLSGFLSNTAGQNSFPGLALGIYRDGIPIYERSRGIDLNAPQQLASVTKTFTAIAILQLAERGLLGLDDEVSRYYPELEMSRNPLGGRPVTIRHLLNQNSGMPYGSARGQTVRTETGRYYSVVTQIVPAGQSFMYSNYNYYLLGAILERVTGRSYPEYIREEIFDVAGMSQSRVSEQANGASGVSSSVTDLSRFFVALIGRSGEPRLRRLIGDDSLAEIAAVPEHIHELTPDIQYYGLGMRVQYRHGEVSELFHTGIWYNIFAEIRIFPHERSALIHLANPPQFRHPTVVGYRWQSATLAATYVKLVDTLLFRSSNSEIEASSDI